MSAKGFQARKVAQGDGVPSSKRPDAAWEPFALNPQGWGDGRRVDVSAALSVAPTTAIGAFLPTLARRSQRGPFQCLDGPPVGTHVSHRVAATLQALN